MFEKRGKNEDNDDCGDRQKGGRRCRDKMGLGVTQGTDITKS